MLCVVVHPDDEALGVGGTPIKRVERGDIVNFIILSDGKGAKLVKKERNINSPGSLKSKKSLALKRGSEYMQDLAEAFIVIRKIEK